MKTKLSFIFLAIFLFSLPACQRSIFDENQIYIGAWSSRKHFIEIAGNGFGFYQKRNRNLRDCDVKIKRNRIIFDWTGGRKSFRIDAPPAVEITTGRVFMTLDGRDFYRH